MSSFIAQDLTEGRLQLHYAIQLIAATGATLAEPQPDYSHTSLNWSPDLRLFVGTTIAADQPFKVAIDPVALTVLILDETSTKQAELALHQQTLTEGFNWLKGEVAQRGADADKVVWGSEYEQLEGVFGARMRVVQIQLGNEVIELTDYLTPEGKPIPVDSRSNDRWFQHIAIVVSDIDQASPLPKERKHLLYLLY
jgi:hypothetical protein